MALLDDIINLPSTDEGETFSLTLIKTWSIHQLDVKNSFPHGDSKKNCIYASTHEFLGSKSS